MAGIIKAGSEPATGTDTQQVAFNFDDFNQRANQYLDQVRQQARKILEDAKLAAEQQRQEVFESARQSAQQENKNLIAKQVEDQLRPFVKSWESVTDEIVQLRHNWMKEWEAGAVQLAVQIASKVVARELENHPEIVVDLLREALELISGASQVEILVNSRDLALVESQLPALTRGVDRSASVRVQADPAISKGGARVVTNLGEIDQTIETRLQRIQDELLPTA